MTKIRLIGYIALLLALIIYAVVDARYVPYRQTDPEDLITRNRIDNLIDFWLEKLDRQIQADTVCLTGGDSLEVVYLENKYPDMGFVVVVTVRYPIGDDVGNPAGTAIAAYTANPLSDSSFQIRHSRFDSSTVNWMTVYK